MRLRRPRGPGAADSGSATLEAVIIAPVFILLITAAVVLGRIATFDETVQQAAQAAARAGSLARDPDTAKTVASATWTSLIADSTAGAPTNDIHCTSPANTTLPAGFSTTPGSPGAIASGLGTDPSTTMFVITVQCTLKTDWMLGLFSDERVVTETAYSPVDPYRSRTGCQVKPC